MRRLALVLAPLLLAGCGSTPEMSDLQLSAQADALCAIANRQTARIPTPHSPAEVEAFLKRGIAVLTPELAGLRRLRPPSDEADVYSTSVTEFSNKLDALRSAVGRLRAGQDPVVVLKTLQQRLRQIEASEDGAWQALQTPACLNR